MPRGNHYGHERTMRERILGRFKAYPVATRSMFIIGCKERTMADVNAAISGLMAEGLIQSSEVVCNGVVTSVYFLTSEAPFILSYHERQGNRSLVPA